MLPGTLYPKKTHGRSLFVGEFKQHVTVPAADSTTVSGSKPDETGEGSPDVERPQGDSVKVSQKTLTYGEEKGERSAREEDVKVIWKKTEAASTSVKPKKGVAAKAFFTPANPEPRDTDTEQDEEVDGKKRKKPNTPPQQTSPRKNIPPRQIHFPLKTRLVAKGKEQNTSSPKISRTTSEHPNDEEADGVKRVQESEAEETTKTLATPQTATTSQTAPTPQTATTSQTATSQQNKPEQNQQEVVKQKTEVSSPKASKGSSEGHESGESDHESQDLDSTSTDDKHKSIVIKPLDLAGYKLDSEKEETLSVLQPDAVADIKRELAQKGIIVLPPSQVLPTLPEVNEATEDQSQDGSNEEEADQEDEDDKESLDDGTGEGASDKLERKEGFKTNKSFEIRRLQAKAERERESKRGLFGRRFPKLRMKAESPTKGHEGETKGGRLKSALKPPTPPSGDEIGRGILKSPSPLPGKMKISVRIRDPEYDYQEYTDVELESDSMDSVRANSFLSYSDFDDRTEVSSDSSTYSTTTFNESPSELSQSDDDGSLQGSALHRLYDEIDTLSPSRQAEYTEAINREIDSRDSKRSRSAMSRVTRSSLHLPIQQVNPNQLVANYMEAYQDRPMNLFDSMRHESSRQGSREKRRREKRRVSFVEERSPRRHQEVDGFAVENERRRTSANSRHPEMAVAFGPTIVPLKPRQGYTKREWKRRVEKFFETSYANREHTKSRRRTGESGDDAIALHDAEAEFTGTCACCRRSCRPLYDLLDCSRKSTVSHLLWIFLPTIFITVLVCVLVLIAADIIPLNGAANNSTIDGT